MDRHVTDIGSFPEVSLSPVTVMCVEIDDQHRATRGAGQHLCGKGCAIEKAVTASTIALSVMGGGTGSDEAPPELTRCLIEGSTKNQSRGRHQGRPGALGDRTVRGIDVGGSLLTGHPDPFEVRRIMNPLQCTQNIVLRRQNDIGHRLNPIRAKAFQSLQDSANPLRALGVTKARHVAFAIAMRIQSDTGQRTPPQSPTATVYAGTLGRQECYPPFPWFDVHSVLFSLLS